jgi:GntR family transcriptional regulator
MMANQEESAKLNPTVNRHSSLPLHQQLYEILRRKILQDEWQVGDMIPPEPELMERYDLSRITVRRGLNRLANEGLIYRQQGRGSFVAERTLEQGLTRIVSFTEDMNQRSLIPRTEVLFSDLVPAPDDVAERLGLQPGVEMARLERLRIANDEPLSIEESFLAHSYCPGILDEDFADSSLRESLDANFGIRIVRAKQIIRAVRASTRQARLLAITARSPLLFVERVSYSQQNQPVEFLRIYYRGDRYSLFNELNG